MPINKEKGLRFDITERLLKKSKGITVNEICKHVNDVLEGKGIKSITPRTIYNDIEELKSDYGIDIIKEGNRHRYANASVSYKKPEINSEEQDAVDLGMAVIASMKRVNLINKFSDVVNRFMAGNIFDSLDDEEKPRIIQIGESYNDSGYNYIEKVYQAIKTKTAIRVLYTNNAGETYWRIISPYLLKEYRNQWYMVGYTEHSSRRPSSSVFNLSKIDSIKPAEEHPYVIDPAFDADNYFKYCLGVFHDLYKQPIVVKLKFIGKYYLQLFSYYKLHSTMQVVSKTEDEIVVTIEVYNERELKELILGYQNNVEVLEPQTLRDEIKDIIEKIASLYKNK
jgi:predicted DNA-binding transcriptional regulator YafY